MTIPIYTVYKTTNIINNKIYIGVHKTTNPNDSYLGSGLHLKTSIQKYGKQNFKKEILFEYDNEHDAYLKESQLVDDKFIKNNNNYNLTCGGSGGNKINFKTTKHHMLNKHHSISTKIKISNSMKGNVVSNETKRKISQSNLGKKLTKSQCENISKSKIGINNPKFIGYWICNFIKYDSLSSASKIINMESTTIRNYCKNPDKIITKSYISHSKYFQSLKESPLGKTFREIGFYFESNHNLKHLQ